MASSIKFNIVEDKAAREELQNLVREPDRKVVLNILDEEKPSAPAFGTQERITKNVNPGFLLAIKN